MSNSDKYRKPAQVAIVCACMALGAGADRVAAAEGLALEAGVSTEYIGKGVGKSSDEPVAFGTARLSSGIVYASAFATSAEFSQGADAEVILTAGVQPRLGVMAFDLAVLDRRVIGNRAGFDDDYIEFQADAIRGWGPAKLRARLNYSADGYGAAEQAWWSEAQVSWKISDKSAVSAAYGARRVDIGSDYDAWNIGLKHTLAPRIAADLRYYDTNRHEISSEFDAKLVAALTLSF